MLEIEAYFARIRDELCRNLSYAGPELATIFEPEVACILCRIRRGVFRSIYMVHSHEIDDCVESKF